MPPGDPPRYRRRHTDPSASKEKSNPSGASPHSHSLKSTPSKVDPPEKILVPNQQRKTSKTASHFLRHSQTQQVRRPASQPQLYHHRLSRARDKPRPQSQRDLQRQRELSNEKCHRKDKRSPSLIKSSQGQQTESRKERQRRDHSKKIGQKKYTQVHSTFTSSGNNGHRKKPLEPEEEGKVVSASRRDHTRFSRHNQQPRPRQRGKNVHSSLPPQRKKGQKNDRPLSMPPVKKVDTSRVSSISDSESSSESSSSSDSESSSSSNSSSDGGSKEYSNAPKASYNTTHQKMNSKLRRRKLTAASVTTAASTAVGETVNVRKNRTTFPMEKSRYDALLTFMEGRRESTSPVLSVESKGKTRRRRQRPTDNVKNYPTDCDEAFAKQVKEGGHNFHPKSHSTYSRKKPDYSTDDGSSSESSFYSMYSCQTDYNALSANSTVASLKSPPLPFSSDDNTMQQQIHYHKPELEYIADQLKEIKEQAELIHKRVEDEVIIEDQRDIICKTVVNEVIIEGSGVNSKSFNASILTEESGDRSSCFDLSTAENNNESSYLMGMMDSFTLSEIELQKSGWR